VACGDTPDEAQTLIAEAIQLHVASLREHGDAVPAPAAMTGVVHAA
jgi:predicted RNase H-like HicB family nuclease